MTRNRTTAKRVFAQELNDASAEFQESDDDRAPVYNLLPTGGKANRILVAGVLCNIRDVSNDDSPYIQAEVIDARGDSVYAYAGQYQPDARDKLQELESPTRIAIVGKPRIYETDDGTVNVSIRPEHVTEISREERRLWTQETAERTIERIESFDPADDEYDRQAVAEYDPDLSTYLNSAIENLEELGGEGDEETGEDEESDGLEEQLREEVGYNELKGLAATVDGVNPNQSHEELAAELAEAGVKIPA